MLFEYLKKPTIMEIIKQTPAGIIAIQAGFSSLGSGRVTPHVSNDRMGNIIVGEPRPEGLAGWKYREMDGADRALSEHHTAERAAIARTWSFTEGEKDRTAAREDWSFKNARYCAGHDWVKERQERTGEIERSR